MSLQLVGQLSQYIITTNQMLYNQNQGVFSLKEQELNQLASRVDTFQVKISKKKKEEFEATLLEMNKASSQFNSGCEMLAKLPDMFSSLDRAEVEPLAVAQPINAYKETIEAMSARMHAILATLVVVEEDDDEDFEFVTGSSSSSSLSSSSASSSSSSASLSSSTSSPSESSSSTSLSSSNSSSSESSSSASLSSSSSSFSESSSSASLSSSTSNSSESSSSTSSSSSSSNSSESSSSTSLNSFSSNAIDLQSPSDQGLMSELYAFLQQCCASRKV